MSATKPNRKRGFGFFILLAVSLWFTGFFAWSQTLLWQNAISDILKASVIADKVTVSIEAIVETLIISGLFAFYLWLAYTLSEGFREVFEGLFGLNKERCPEKTPENKTATRESEKFDKENKDMEILKINLVAEEIRTGYFNLLAIIFSFMISIAIVELGFGTQIGLAVYVGLLMVLFILGGYALAFTRRYLKRFSRLQPLIHNVENGKTNGDLNEMLKALGK